MHHTIVHCLHPVVTNIISPITGTFNASYLSRTPALSCLVIVSRDLKLQSLCIRLNTKGEKQS